MKTLDTKWKVFGLTSQGTGLRGDITKCSIGSAHLAPSDNHLCLADICIIILFVSCFSYIQGCRPLFLKQCHRASVIGTGWRNRETQRDRLEKRQRGPGIDIKWKRTTEEWWISEGWIEDERDGMRVGEGHGRGGRGGRRMERLVLGNRVSLDANSSHLERLMDRGQHFCTYPSSLPPQSITRQSIKSSKKRRKAPAKALRVWCCFSAALLLLSQPRVCVGFVLGWFRTEWHKELSYFHITTCAKVIFKFLWLEQHVPVWEDAVLLLKDSKSHPVSWIIINTWGNIWLDLSWSEYWDIAIKLYLRVETLI